MVEQDEKSRSRSRVSVGQIAIGTPSYTFKSKLTGPLAPTGTSQNGLGSINILNMNTSTSPGTLEKSLSQRGGTMLNNDSMKENLDSIDHVQQ